MDSNRRALELLFQDLIVDWGELHDQVKAARLNAQSCTDLCFGLEQMIDNKAAQLMSTINDQLENQKTLDLN